MHGSWPGHWAGTCSYSIFKSTCISVVLKGSQVAITQDYVSVALCMYVYIYVIIICAKQKHQGCKKGAANQKQQLSGYIIT